MLDKNLVGFKLGQYDRERELIIDPQVYASYLGSTIGGDNVWDITVDRNGMVYTASQRTVPHAFWNTTKIVMINKFDLSKPPSEQLLWVRFVGGSEFAIPRAIDVDDDGKVYVTGNTGSPDFPLYFAEQSTHSINVLGRDYMAFVFRLNADGSIHYSTFLGGGCTETYTQNWSTSIDADSNGNAYVTGFTCASDFPVKNAFQATKQNRFNAFLTKYNSFGNLTYSTFFGGNTRSSANDVVTDAQGNVYITGNTDGAGVHTTSGAYRTSGLGFAAKFNLNRTGAQSLIYSTYIDGRGAALAVDGSGNSWHGVDAYCESESNCIPSWNLLKLNSTGTALVRSPVTLK